MGSRKRHEPIHGGSGRGVLPRTVSRAHPQPRRPGGAAPRRRISLRVSAGALPNVARTSRRDRRLHAASAALSDTSEACGATTGTAMLNAAVRRATGVHSAGRARHGRRARSPQQLSFHSGVREDVSTPRLPRLEHGVQDHQQLAHARRQRHLRRLPLVTQPLVERPQHRVVPSSHQGGHVQRAAHQRPTAVDAAPALPASAVAIERRHPASALI